MADSSVSVPVAGVTLARRIGGFQLWGISVGLVISGEYFGWSYGWGSAGTLGFLVVTVFVAVVYTALIFSFTELTTAIPRAGGPFAYALRAFGPSVAACAGVATLVEFLFASPAVALGIGAYLHVQFPGLPPRLAASGAYALFTALNLLGVTVAASFELVITLVAIFELLVFMGVVAPGFAWSRFAAHGWGMSGSTSAGSVLHGWMQALPFAIWFFLGLEGAAMAAEETRNPARTVPRAYLAGIGTLLVLAFGVMLLAGGVTDWRTLSNINDPLPQAMREVVGAASGWLGMLVWLGLFGLIASFHGNIITSSRQMFALAREGYLPRWMGRLDRRFRTPQLAILAGSAIGLAAIYSDSLVNVAGQSLTAMLVTLSVFGALTLHLISMASLFRLRRSEPSLARPYSAPFYPVLPAAAIVAVLAIVVVLVWLNPGLAAFFAVLLVLGVGQLRLRQQSPAETSGSDVEPNRSALFQQSTSMEGK